MNATQAVMTSVTLTLGFVIALLIIRRHVNSAWHREHHAPVLGQDVWGWEQSGRSGQSEWPGVRSPSCRYCTTHTWEAWLHDTCFCSRCRNIRSLEEEERQERQERQKRGGEQA